MDLPVGMTTSVIRPARRIRWLGTTLAVAILGVRLWAGAHVYHVHDESWQWRWTPSATPPKLRFEGRDYKRGGTYEHLKAGEIVVGRTAGGGIIYDLPGPNRYASTLLQVRDGRRLVSYELMGGP
jgi:hypothetical protein